MEQPTAVHADLVAALDDDMLVAEWKAGRLVVVEATPEQRQAFADALAKIDAEQSSETS